ncbi:MAG: hypothetical protein LBU32_21595 [Clostridiales bacterium]|nr:hypothetical protein [Clostridiales bacterium]
MKIGIAATPDGFYVAHISARSVQSAVTVVLPVHADIAPIARHEDYDSRRIPSVLFESRIPPRFFGRARPP